MVKVLGYIAIWILAINVGLFPFIYMAIKHFAEDQGNLTAWMQCADSIIDGVRILLACGMGVLLRCSKRWKTLIQSLDKKRIQNAVIMISIFWIVYFFSDGLQNHLYVWLVQMESLHRETVGAYLEASPLVLFLGETFVYPRGFTMMLAGCLVCAILSLPQKLRALRNE